MRATLEIVPVGVWPFNAFGVTGESITTGINNKLNWLPQHYNIKFDGQRYKSPSSSMRFANSLASGAFKQIVSHRNFQGSHSPDFFDGGL